MEYHPSKKDLWLIKADLLNSPWDIKYINSVYFSFVTMTTVGYGDISAVSSVEKIFCVLMMIFSCAVFAYAVNIIGLIIEKIGMQHEKFRQNCRDISIFMKKRNINKQTQSKVKNYMEYMYFEKQNENSIEITDEIINSLPSKLKNELYKDTYSPFFKNCDFFLCSSLFLA